MSKTCAWPRTGENLPARPQLRRRAGQAYALKYQQHLSHLILNSTFPSTRQMNEVLAREKAQMPPDKLKRLDELEAAGLFGKVRPGARPLHREYEALAWGPATFRSSTARGPIPLRSSAGQCPATGTLPRDVGSHGEFIIDGN